MLRQVRRVINLRSPWLPLNAGILLLLLSLLVWYSSDADLIGWLLLALAAPLAIEGEAWREAAYGSHYFYDVEPEVVHWEAYNPKGAIPRYLLLLTYMLSLLIGREAEALPDKGWMIVVMIVGPVLVYAAMAARSFIKDIRLLMRVKGIESKLSKRHQRR